MSAPFLARVYDAKYKFHRLSGVEATHIFLGPLERLELSEYVKQLEAENLINQNVADALIGGRNWELADMRVVLLVSDGLYAGRMGE